MCSVRVLLRVRVTLAVLLAALCGVWAPAGDRAARARVDGVAGSPPERAAAFGFGQVPAGFRLSPLAHEADQEAARRFFALVTTDVDADGDVDVIAGDGDFDLRIWINDGRGHLSTRPARATTASLFSRAVASPSSRRRGPLAWFHDDDPRQFALQEASSARRGGERAARLLLRSTGAVRGATFRSVPPRGPPHDQHSA